MRRFTRLTNRLSKKFENHCHSVALHYAYYSSFYKELQARKYAEDKNIPIDEYWVITSGRIQSMKGFDQGYYNAEGYKLFLEKHILGRET